MNRIAVLASGGDAPGMNACIRAVVRAAGVRSTQVVGVWDGYNGLVDRRLQPLASRDVANMLQRGGSMIGSGRSAAFLRPEVREECVGFLRAQGVEGLVVIGGEGSLKGAMELHRLGMPTVTVPGTIDNDMPGTDITIGADTAIHTAVGAIDQIRDTASAHHRAMIVQVMGRYCGYIAVMAGLATGAEVILTPERPTDLDHVLEEMEEVFAKGKRHCIIVLAEGAPWPAAELTRLINDSPTPFEARYTVLGYVQRGGSPTPFDRILATRLGVGATDALLDGRSGVLTAWKDGRVQVRDGDRLEPRADPWPDDLPSVHLVTNL
jgi:6-phosphofructokinase 1